MPAPSRTVLIVDQDEAIRAMVRLTLEGERTVVVEAEDVDQALVVAHDHHPDVALVDLDLPEGGGLDACRLLRDRADLRTIVLVPKDRLGRLRDDTRACDAVLTKPFTTMALLRKVDEVLA